MEKAKPTPAALTNGLAQFYGTERYYRHMGPIVLTDGTKWLAENAGCYWLYDIVFSVLPRIEAKTDGFAVITLSVDLQHQNGMVVIGTGNDNDNDIYRQRIPYTDFPLPEITLFLEDGEVGGKPCKVLLLPSEH